MSKVSKCCCHYHCHLPISLYICFYTGFLRLLVECIRMYFGLIFTTVNPHIRSQSLYSVSGVEHIHFISSHFVIFGLNEWYFFVVVVVLITNFANNFEKFHPPTLADCRYVEMWNVCAFARIVNAMSITKLTT